MKFLFVIQGEGKDHLSQALLMEEMLMRSGHKVVELLVGSSEDYKLPGFFNRNVCSTVKRFISPNYFTDCKAESNTLKKKIADSLLSVPEYYKSMCYIHNRIIKTGAEVVINFYECLTGLTYTLFRPSVPYICVGHQYMFLHSSYKMPDDNKIEQALLKLYTRITSLRSKRCLALSLRKMEDDNSEKISVVPPMMSRELMSLSTVNGDYVLSSGDMIDEVNTNHKSNPDVPIHFFINNLNDRDDIKVDDTLSYHSMDETKYLNYISKCKAYSNQGEFRHICEALYLGKALLMIPRNIEQRCNAHHAMAYGAGMIKEQLNLKELLDYSEYYQQNMEYVYWARSSERYIMNAIDELVNNKVYTKSSNLSSCMAG